MRSLNLLGRKRSSKASSSSSSSAPAAGSPSVPAAPLPAPVRGLVYLFIEIICFSCIPEFGGVGESFN